MLEVETKCIVGSGADRVVLGLGCVGISCGRIGARTIRIDKCYSRMKKKNSRLGRGTIIFRQGEPTLCLTQEELPRLTAVHVQLLFLLLPFLQSHLSQEESRLMIRKTPFTLSSPSSLSWPGDFHLITSVGNFACY